VSGGSDPPPLGNHQYGSSHASYAGESNHPQGHGGQLHAQSLVVDKQPGFHQPPQQHHNHPALPYAPQQQQYMAQPLADDDSAAYYSQQHHFQQQQPYGSQQQLGVLPLPSSSAPAAQYFTNAAPISHNVQRLHEKPNRMLPLAGAQPTSPTVRSPAHVSSLQGGGVLHGPPQPYFGANVAPPQQYLARGGAQQGADAKQRYAEELREQAMAERERREAAKRAAKCQDEEAWAVNGRGCGPLPGAGGGGGRGMGGGGVQQGAEGGALRAGGAGSAGMDEGVKKLQYADELKRQVQTFKCLESGV